jgi:REP element-mobilizing transposase RayT
MKARQLLLLPRSATEYGGRTRLKLRKVARPFSPKLAVHLVFRSDLAKGERSMLLPRHKHLIQTELNRLSKRYRIKVYNFVNVGNHLHLLVKSETKQNLQKFLRVFTGQIAQTILQAKKGRAKGKFWSSIVYSRLVSFGRDFKTVMNYFVKNQVDAIWALVWLGNDLNLRGG